MNESLPVNEKPTESITEAKRNTLGLLKDLEYKYRDDKTIDWRALVPVKYLYVNPVNNSGKKSISFQKKYGKAANEVNLETDTIKDEDLVVSLAGIKYLLALRGYTNVSYKVISASTEYAAVSCEIAFIPNVETEFQRITFADNACAHLENTSSFGKKYLLEVATNRALCRTIRNFLNINIVSSFELSEETNDEPLSTEQTLLLRLMTENKLTFEKVQQNLAKNGDSEANSYTSIQDIPKYKILELIERIKKKFKE